MPLPDFLVIGAAKSGTVSLYHYLDQHPQIYMCPINEPNFFALDGLHLDNHFHGPGDRATVERHCVRDRAAYEAHFAAAGPDQRLGESSPLYLYSAHAARRIHQLAPQARLIALLRHPTARAHANYRHYRIAGIEPLPTFEQALQAETARLAWGWGPWPFWGYRDVGHYATQLQRYHDLFDPGQILVCFYEELRDDPLTLLQKLHTFIGVDGDFIPDTSVRHNIGSRPRFHFLRRLTTQPNRLRDTLKVMLPSFMRTWLRERVLRLNEKRRTLDPATRRHLTRDYAPDIRRLQALTGHDLRHWLEE
jgi:hypothetical protein